MFQSDAITIDSEYLMDKKDLHKHFKIIAGPGAGKTHWLVKHIRNVLQNSERLGKVSKIACITYTTVGSEEIIERLGTDIQRVEVSTIHSFLYKNIVKPYCYLLRNSDGTTLVNVDEMDGHEENKVSNGRLMEWKKANNLFYMKDDSQIKECLEALEWYLKEDEIVLRVRRNVNKKIDGYYISKDHLLSYKKLCWKRGIIHHEDVLYFSYKILKEFPIILDCLSAKYPFIFLDEFQDTNPIQTEIIKWLAYKGSVVGIIGDPAQSIFKFQGASRNDFIAFSLPNQLNFKITQNRRSSPSIVKILNFIRKHDSLQQTPIREGKSYPVMFMEYNDDNIMELITIFHRERENKNLNNDYCVLARYNDSVKILRDVKTLNVWDALSETDSSKRDRFIRNIILARQFAKEGRYEVAVKQMMKVFTTDRNRSLKSPFRPGQTITSMQKRSLAVSLLEYVMNYPNSIENISLYNYYNDLSLFLSKAGYKITNYGKGKAKDFAETTIMSDLINDLKMPEEKTSTIRTIHKAKGAEFESVLVLLDNIELLELLLNPDINSNEDDIRILYVALSRAEDFLFIATPPLTATQRHQLEELGMKMVSKTVREEQLT
ncbi:UvrD-helicase domain-containing protein [Parageobacillus thermoglucosidasius]|uniref:UvrD-helicase domain-containing protein n=1 Tax=Parageobacillus thermoglucosidasius TaxID=1426 RepID=UPI0001D18C6A|nr:ATP-dependent helicase [Parageobacillus thermoglucosidasius]AEH49283.1 UvrD/REP helicase [Parageobacillus thermoglucosidasius C56-YS93]